MSPTRLLTLAPVVLFLGCGDMPVIRDQPDGQAGPEVKKHLDEKTLAVLAGATRVEVFRLKASGPFSQQPQAPEAKRVGGFAVTAQGKDQGQAFAARLARILLDGKTYSTTFAACFTPGVAFRVWQEKDCVDVIVCFKCQNLYCGPATEHATANASFVDTPASGGLARLAKEAFPGDKEIQALDEK